MAGLGAKSLSCYYCKQCCLSTKKAHPIPIGGTVLELDLQVEITQNKPALHARVHSLSSWVEELWPGGG